MNNTPVYIKSSKDFEWPEDRFFYLVASNGLFLCRNHGFFQSAVPVKSGPSELQSQEKFLKLSYPLIPRHLVELAVGFFHRVWKKQNSEAAVVFAWNRNESKVELIVPDQTGINSSKSPSNPKGCPQDVKYEIPELPQGWALIGDMHCHVDGSAYASGIDEADEEHRPGVHIVVGHIGDEPPDFFCEAVQDKERFKVEDMSLVIEGYNQRRPDEVPDEWMGKVKLKCDEGFVSSTTSYGYTPSNYTGYNPLDDRPTEEDKGIIRRILSKLAKGKVCPSLKDLKHELFVSTKSTRESYCKERAKQFIDSWPKIKEHHEKQTQ